MIRFTTAPPVSPPTPSGFGGFSLFFQLLGIRRLACAQRRVLSWQSEMSNFDFLSAKQEVRAKF